MVQWLSSPALEVTNPLKLMSKIQKTSSKSNQISSSNHLIFMRFKAFVTDIFMIYTPLLYIMTYIVLGSAQSFRENQSAIFICIFLYGFISSAFFAAKSQTPGYRYMGLILQTKDNKNPTLLLALLRFFIWLLSMSLLIGLLFPFFHPQKITLHDLICRTKVLKNS